MRPAWYLNMKLYEILTKSYGFEDFKDGGSTLGTDYKTLKVTVFWISGIYDNPFGFLSSRDLNL